MFPEVPRAPQYLETMFEADTPNAQAKYHNERALKP